VGCRLTPVQFVTIELKSTDEKRSTALTVFIAVKAEPVISVNTGPAAG
jgi:hypothetical protein